MNTSQPLGDEMDINYNATPLSDQYPEKAAAIRAQYDTTVPRCGTCGEHCDPFHSDEGYSHCCNDRIEYPDEYCGEGGSMAVWVEDLLYVKMQRVAS